MKKKVLSILLIGGMLLLAACNTQKDVPAEESADVADTLTVDAEAEDLSAEAETEDLSATEEVEEDLSAPEETEENESPEMEKADSEDTDKQAADTATDNKPKTVDYYNVPNFPMPENITKLTLEQYTVSTDDNNQISECVYTFNALEGADMQVEIDSYLQYLGSIGYYHGYVDAAYLAEHNLKSTNVGYAAIVVDKNTDDVICTMYMNYDTSRVDVIFNPQYCW